MKYPVITKQAKVAAYITLYNDLQAAQNCIAAIQSQSVPISKLLVLDNSQTELLDKYKYNYITAFHRPDNAGIGYGLALAINTAIESGYDFLWVFDQDSIPASNCLERLLDSYNLYSKDNYPIATVAPTAIDIKTNSVVQGVIFNGKYFIACEHQIYQPAYECDAPITSGSLINLTAAKTIALPRDDLFIDGIDLDYGLRFKLNNFHNIIVTNAIMQHNFGDCREVNFLNRRLFLQSYTALRHYYICRNHTYLEIRYAQGFCRLVSLLYRCKYMLFTIIKIILYDNNDKIKKIWACLLGTYDGIRGKLGKKYN